ncbi:MAG: tRNA threonylcarbamoyladenosine dehydratase [Clostridia bacterium]|nr:tRNA threonylcarbamoyladenosine dehydratase [Clostridia bacterium]
MAERFMRTEAIFGKENMDKLQNAHVLVFGIGGVGGYAVEALVRSGIGTIGIVDNDRVAKSNLNRQIIADETTIDMYKTDVAEERIKKINPRCNVHKYNVFYMPDCKNIPFENYDYVVDAIDTVTAKIDIIQKCKALNIPVISSMGTGNKTDPTKLQVTDIQKTSFCPLARVMRHELKKRSIKNVKVVYSTEEPISKTVEGERQERHTPGSFMPVPATAGLIIAAEVIKDIIHKT